jgi:hypothetical protein
LSIIVTGANSNDVTQIGTVLDAIVITKPSPPKRRSKHLCADAGYKGKRAKDIILRHGYIPHVKGRSDEAKELKLSPSKKARAI